MIQRCIDRSDHGATAVEYAIMVTMIAVFISGAVAVFGLSVADLFLPIIDIF